MMKRVAPWICCLGVLAAPTGAHAQDRTLDRIRQTGVFTIAHREASIPFSYLDGDTPRGYAVELCQRIAERVRAELKLPQLRTAYVMVTSASRLATVAEGKADIECGSTTNNAERRRQVAFTVPHFISSSRLLVRKGEGIRELNDLRGKRIVSTKGTTILAVVRRLDAERQIKATLIEAKEHADSLRMVVSREADAFAMDDVLLYGLRAVHTTPDELEVVGKPMTIEPYAMVLARDSVAFKTMVDAEMRRLILSREIYAIYDKWFTQPIPPKGINLRLPVPFLLRDSFKFPTDKVND